jgi:hypothetical protein
MNPETILQDPAASWWLKESLIRALSRDPVDALGDAEILVEVLKARMDALLAS